MSDPRYLECRKCGARDQIEVSTWMKAAVGDGVPTVSTQVRDIEDWYCTACDARDYDWRELCFIGYPGITEAEKAEQAEA